MSSQDDIRAKRLERLNKLAQKDVSQKSNTSKPLGGNQNEDPRKIQVTKQITESPSIQTPPTKQARIQEYNPEIYLAEVPKKLKNWIINEVLPVLSSSFEVSQDSNVFFVESTFKEVFDLELNDDATFVSLFTEKNIVDRIILENLTEIGRDSPSSYIFDIWIKAQESYHKVDKKHALRKTSLKPHESKLFNIQKLILSETIRLAAAYGFLLFQIPDMYINGSEESSFTFFLQSISNPLFSEFSVRLIEEAKAQDALLDLLNVWLPGLSKYLVHKRVADLANEKYVAILNFYSTILQDKSVASIFTKINTFACPANYQKASNLESITLLGPILRVAPFGRKEALRLYDNSSGTKNKMMIQETQKSTGNQHRNLVNNYLFPICDKIVRGGADSRKDLLEYFTFIINQNHLRVATRPNYDELSSNQFIINISLILVKFSLPFLGNNYSKIDKINMDYFGKDISLSIDEETRVNSTLKEANDHYKSAPADNTPTNFITDCYFLTLTYAHFGFVGLASFEDSLSKLKDHLEKRVGALEAQISQAAPQNRLIVQTVVKRQSETAKKQLAIIESEICCVQAFFLNNEMQYEIFEFLSASCVFLTKVIDPTHRFPRTPVKIPLKPDDEVFENIDNAEELRKMSPVPFKFYPEYCIESIIAYVTHIIKYFKNPLTVNPGGLNSFIEFAVLLLRCPEVMSNPHLKSKLVESLFYGSIPMFKNSSDPGLMISSFFTNKVVLDHLLYSLLDFYVAVERTGASSQFYDKFNSRYHISEIIEKLWSFEHYRNQLRDYSEHHEAFFIRFIARMLNDTTYLLDESLNQLTSIHHLSLEIDKRNRAGNLEEAINSDYEGIGFDELNDRLRSLESHAKSSNSLTNKTLELFGMFSKEVSSAFTKPEIVDRLAGMLDYNLNQLAGPKYKELKVKSPEKYHFDPRKLITDISKIFINLSVENDFVVAVSRDARSFSKELFYSCQAILKKLGKLNSDELKILTDFAEKADAIRLEEKAEEEAWGDDVPEEFLDPLMYNIMEDPVILPSSKTVVDRSTIKAHLLSDPTDPFNRQPLKIEQVIPDDELRAKIVAFRKEMRQKKQQENDEDVVMKDS